MEGKTPVTGHHQEALDTDAQSGRQRHTYARVYTHTLKHTDTDTHPESSEGIHVGLGVQRRGFEAHEASGHD